MMLASSIWEDKSALTADSNSKKRRVDTYLQQADKCQGSVLFPCLPRVLDCNDFAIIEPHLLRHLAPVLRPFRAVTCRDYSLHPIISAPRSLGIALPEPLCSHASHTGALPSGNVGETQLAELTRERTAKCVKNGKWNPSRLGSGLRM